MPHLLYHFPAPIVYKPPHQLVTNYGAVLSSCSQVGSSIPVQNTNGKGLLWVAITVSEKNAKIFLLIFTIEDVAQTT